MSDAAEELDKLLKEAGLTVDFDHRRDNTKLSKEMYALFLWVKQTQHIVTDEAQKFLLEDVLQMIYDISIEAKGDKNG